MLVFMIKERECSLRDAFCDFERLRDEQSLYCAAGTGDVVSCVIFEEIKCGIVAISETSKGRN